MSVVTPTQPVAELQPFLASRRVRAGAAPSPARSRATPVSNDERANNLDDDALLLAARHRAELKIERARGLREGHAQGIAKAQTSHFWSGAAFGCLIGSALVYCALVLGLSL